MFKPERMDFVQILFPKKEIDNVVSVLVGEGYVQLIDPAEAEPWANTLENPVPFVDLEVSQRISDIKKTVNLLSIDVDFENVRPLRDNWDSIMKRFEKLKNNVESLDTKIKTLDKSIADKSAILKNAIRITSQGEINFSAESGTFINFDYIRVKNDKLSQLYSDLAGYPHTSVTIYEQKNETALMLITLKKDEHAVKEILFNAETRSVSSEEKKRFIPEKASLQLREEILRLEQEKTAVLSQLDKIRKDEKDFLVSILYKGLIQELSTRVVQRFRKTETTFLVTGWIPSDMKQRFEREILLKTQNRCILNFIPAEKLKSVQNGQIHVPVEVNNPGFFKPFELITKTFGIPDYRSIDPTPIVAFSFLFMFGIMFGDLGHGAVLALTGFIMSVKSSKSSFKNAGHLLLYAGASSMIFGVLFGSIFGVEHWIKPVWLKPMESIGELFKVAIYFGIGMISLAIVFNIINGIREKSIKGVLFDKAGLFAGILYWCGIAVTMRFISTKPVPDLPVIIPLLMVISVVLIFIHEPVLHLLQGKKQLFPEGVTTGIMGGIIEILEISLGFLANTVSFIRIAAFGLAHAGLFMAIFSLSDSVSHIAGGVVSGIVLVLGNIGIICLEGLVVSIQAVRLEFYEFFSRFFRESSYSYKPLKSELLS
ncbi:hypothetical protein DRQ07_05315 [candidate division KSB1 bacterium]|nr:MAG: hypothetical protein DRQ07_05315 [candidate division KSB1 bacterium]